MKRKKYRSDISDKEWEILKKYIPEIAEGGNRKYEIREVVNGIYYVLRTGCAWEYIPHDLPHWKTCYEYFRKWSEQGIWKVIEDEIRKRLRKEIGKEEQPTAVILDSQAVKTTEKGGSVDMMEERKSKEESVTQW